MNANLTSSLNDRGPLTVPQECHSWSGRPSVDVRKAIANCRKLLSASGSFGSEADRPTSSPPALSPRARIENVQWPSSM